MTQPYQIAESKAGKGQGVFATRDIKAGEVIIDEKPVLAFDLTKRAIKGRAPPPAVFDAYVKLDSTGQEWLRSLTESDSAEQKIQNAKDALRPGNRHVGLIIAKFNNNCFAGDMVDLLPRDGARINHSCAKNATWDAVLERFVVRAIVDISEGEEILISYVRVVKPRAERQESLSNYGFTCNCEKCDTTHPDFAESEQRRIETQKWSAALPTVRKVMEKRTSTLAQIEACEKVVCEFEKESSLIDELAIKQEVLAHLYYHQRHEDTSQHDKFVDKAIETVCKAIENARIPYGEEGEITRRCVKALERFRDALVV